jgi:hypothetical protein
MLIGSRQDRGELSGIELETMLEMGPFGAKYIVQTPHVGIGRGARLRLSQQRLALLSTNVNSISIAYVCEMDVISLIRGQGPHILAERVLIARS